jgi:hypothetical protein
MQFCIILSSALLSVLIVEKEFFLMSGGKKRSFCFPFPSGSVQSNWHGYSSQPLHHEWVSNIQDLAPFLLARKILN